jgi:hypothetical protein
MIIELHKDPELKTGNGNRKFKTRYCSSENSLLAFLNKFSINEMKDCYELKFSYTGEVGVIKLYDTYTKPSGKWKGEAEDILLGELSDVGWLKGDNKLFVPKVYIKKRQKYIKVLDRRLGT